MRDLPLGLIAILQKYMRDPNAPVAGATALSELEIDMLDLPMICLDVEDAFAICIETAIAAKALQPKRSSVPRSTRGWMAA
jgi:hypothetical protein